MSIKEEMVALNKELKAINEKSYDVQQQIKMVRRKCKHKDLKITTWGTATCKTCEASFSWYCPTSPTLECDYEQEDGSYDEDFCRYCGQPEERK